MSSTRPRLRRLGGALACTAMLAAGGASLAGTAGAAPAVVAPPNCPSSTPNGRFVRYLYLNILHRCPDAGGGAYWTARLDNGTPRSAVSNALDMSTENVVENNVNLLYSKLFERLPSSSELHAGVNSIRSTRGDADLTATLASGDEYFANFKSKSTPESAWLNVAYNLVLGRAPDSAGKAYFLDMLGSSSTVATRRRVFMILEHSRENALDWTRSAMSAAFLRPADAGGVAYWMGWLQGAGHWQTFRMWTLMLASPEGYTLAQTQPSAT